MSDLLFDIAPEGVARRPPKLSEAILAGASIRPQAFGSYFAGTTRDDACSCSLGAAYEVTFPGKALAHDAVVLDFDRLAERFPLLNSKTIIFCPECAGEAVFSDNLCNVLIHLNDVHRWARERVAEFMRGYE